MSHKINYQRIYEERVSVHLKESLEMPERFYELSHQDRILVEELVDNGYNLAVEDALDAEVLSETSAIASEMSNQLKSLEAVIDGYLSRTTFGDGN